jgi:glycosyltransferase involved in cell wall biosynthesis
MAVSSARLVDSLRDRGRRVTTLQLRPPADRFVLSSDGLDWSCSGWQGEAERLFFLKRSDMEGKILVGFGGWTAGYLASLWGRWLGCPSLVLFRGNDLDRLIHDPRQGWMVHRTLEMASVAGGVSTEMCARLAALRTGPVVFTPIGIDPREWELFPRDAAAAMAVRQHHAADGRPLVGMFGQLKGKKGLSIAVTVFRDYGVHRLGRLMTVGDIPVEELRELEATCSPFWSHEPYRVRDALLPCYHACDVIFIPSLHDGMPNVLLEAMLCGKLVVASSAGGIADVVRDGVDGFLFPPGDGVAACEVLAHALSLSPQERIAMGEAARNRALEFHRDREAEIVAGALTSLENCHGF